MKNFLTKRLDNIKKNNLYRQPRLIIGKQTEVVNINGKDCLIFCSNNYLGLAYHQKLIKTAQKAANVFGTGAASSRLISGTMESHIKAEETFANFVGLQSSLYFSTGYMANVGTISSLCSNFDAIFSDELNHASIIDGCRLSKSQTVIYKHIAPDDLEQKLKQTDVKGEKFVITESIFSMDGDTAPLKEINEICLKYNANLIVDEAHSLGILGINGKGLCYELNIKPFILIGTMGKAFGTSGAFVAGDKIVKDYLINTSRAFIFSTAPSPIQAEVCICAINLVESADEERKRLFYNIKRLREIFNKLDINTLSTKYHIIPQFVGNSKKSVELSESLFKEGIFVSAIRPPTVPWNKARLRWTLTSLHNEEQINYAGDVLSKIIKSTFGS